MRVSLALTVLFALVLALLPLTALEPELGPAAEPEPSEESSSPGEEPSPVVEDVEEFLILDRSTGKIERVALRDYLRGAVAAELPAEFHREAMKAQAVAAHSYALRRHLDQQERPDPSLKGADFSADPSRLQGYATEEAMRERFGPLADLYWNKICGAADSVSDKILFYEDRPILAAYHASCAGRTEDAANVWGGSIPYLVPVDSPGDLLSPDLETRAVFPAEELSRRLEQAVPGIRFPEKLSDWITVVDRSPSGYVVLADVGDRTLHGQDLRKALGLRSTHFTVSVENGSFVFTVQGYGHGVGLSQYGADYFARQGWTCEQILSHYYPLTFLLEKER